MKFGISFNFTAFNQAGALVHVYKDGSVLINHGGTEMGQGLHTKMLQVAATALGVPLRPVRLAPDPHRQGAQHLRHRGELGRRPQRRRGQGRLRPDPRPAAPGRRRAARRRAGRRAVRRRRRHGLRYRESIAGTSSSRGLLPARPALGGRLLPDRGPALGLTTMQGSPVQVLRLRRRGRRGRGRRLHRRLPTCGASTSCTTSATASRRWSTSARSRAASCRAPAG